MTAPLWAVLAESLDRHADVPALVQHQGRGEPREVRYAELAAMAGHLRGSLFGSLEAGESVGLFMRRSIEHVACIVAALGRVPYYSINPMLSLTQLGDMLAPAKTRVLVVDNAGLLKLSRLEPEQAPHTRIRLVPDGPMATPHEAALEKLRDAFDVEIASTGAAPFEAAGEPASPTALMLFTSGSTGTPRGVAIGHADLAERVAAEAGAYGVEAGDRLLNLLPFSFDVGCNQLLTSLSRGATLVMVNSWLGKDIVGAIDRYGVTGVSGVPAVWTELFKHDETTLRDALGRLRYLTISAGDLSENDHDRLRALAPEAEIFKTYGQTETFRSGILLPHDYDRKRRSVGPPPPGVRVFIVKPDGTLAGPDEEGEIVHEGVGTLIGYVGDAEATDQKLRPHPFPDEAERKHCVYTGDRGRIDAEGFLYVLGRSDRMLKIRGNRVYPEEIERQLLQHPSVETAFVVQRSASAGEGELLAGVKLLPGSTDDPKAIASFLARRVPSYMVPKQVQVLDEIALTSTGKVDLTAAREQIEARLAEASGGGDPS